MNNNQTTHHPHTRHSFPDVGVQKGAACRDGSIRGVILGAGVTGAEQALHSVKAVEALFKRDSNPTPHQTQLEADQKSYMPNENVISIFRRLKESSKSHTFSKRNTDKNVRR